MDKLVTTASERFVNPEAHARDRWVQAQAARLAPGSWILDAGAGASKYRPFFSHCRYETQDFCQYTGTLVQYREPITYVSDITSIPLPDHCLDAILCTEVIEHVVDPIAVVKECSRLLKPGGKLLLTSPLVSHLHMEPYHFFGGFTHYWYEHWLPKFDFRIDSITPVGGPGRTCAVFVLTLHMAWSAREKKAAGPVRLLSMGLRALCKPVMLYALPWFLPKLDRWLGAYPVCSGYLVAATRSETNAKLCKP